MKRVSLLLLLLPVLFLTACKKDVTSPAVTTLRMDLKYTVDGVVLRFDTMVYMNAAGSKYSVNRLEYYLSGFTLKKADGASWTTDAVFYINARDPQRGSVVLTGIPAGTYTSVQFYVGLDSVHNKTGYLPNTLENINMAWPDAMGGGYHFMKMEGYFLERVTKKQTGYAMHLGKNPNLVPITLALPLTLEGSSVTKTLSMNINEWFKNPQIYDLETDGNYSMGSPAAMLKLSQNGKDIFTID